MTSQDYFSIYGAGSAPILLHLPHSSDRLVDEFADWVVDEDLIAREHHLLVDWYTDRLFSPYIECGARALRNNISRLVFDPERYPREEDEAMSNLGMWVFYTHGVHKTRIKREPSQQQKMAWMDRLYWPYHHTLEHLMAKQIDRFGVSLLIDGHSYSPWALPYEGHTEQRHEVCLGTVDGHTPQWLVLLAQECFHGYDVGLNTPFAGSLVPMKFLDDPRCLSLMLEIRRDVYLDLDGDRRPLWSDEKAAQFQKRLALFCHQTLSHLGISTCG